MDSLVILGLLVGLPIILGLLLRVSALILFLSLLIGQLFVQFLGDDAVLAMGVLFKGGSADAYTTLGILLVPVFITLLVARKSVPVTKALINVPFLVMTGLTLAVLALPLMPNHIEAEIYSAKTGNTLRQTQDDIVGLVGLSYLAFIWFTYRHKPGHRGKHGRH